MLITLAFAAALQGAPPPARFTMRRPANRPCAADQLEQAGNGGVLYRKGDRPAEQRRLDELPDADMVLTVLKRDGTGCPIIDVVRRGVSTPEQAPIVGVPLNRAPSLLRGGRERQR